MKLFVINDDQPKVFASLLIFESILFYSRLSSPMENNIEHSCNDQAPSPSAVSVSTQRSVSTSLPSVQHRPGASVTVRRQQQERLAQVKQEREQRRKRERELVRQWQPRRLWNVDMYEEYVQTQLEHYLETENLEIL